MAPAGKVALVTMRREVALAAQIKAKSPAPGAAVIRPDPQAGEVAAAPAPGEKALRGRRCGADRRAGTWIAGDDKEHIA
ncbi:MAG: hypothetical protein R3C46_03895 [Hyphomonadaceae bacterium]